MKNKGLILSMVVVLVMGIFAGCTRISGNKPLETESTTTYDDKREDEYKDEWLDKETAEKLNGTTSEDMIITEIYSNCFFARTVIFSPYEYKINGDVSGEWCVGDQVLVTYDEGYHDSESQRIEGDLISIKVSDFEIDPNACYKPVIYLYPEYEMEVSVNLNLNGEFTCTYPEYNEGWRVIAMPDGTLIGENGMEYNYLYWEGTMDAEFDFSEGFCVKGEDTAEFLEKALEDLGLNRQEANEFIVYWLPLMQENPYNVIAFQTEVYTEGAELIVNPEPDTLIRVFMTYKASDGFVEIKEQELIGCERNGFTVVEWGGTEVE